ncbi:MAG: amidohydrolase family protein [Chitinophagales bacterium]
MSSRKIFGWLIFLFSGLYAKSQHQTIVISGIHIISTNDGKIESDMSVLIEDSLIKDIGKTSKLKIPPGAMIIDGRGKWMIPGLIDAHIHFFQSGGLYTRPDGLNLGKYYSYEKDQQWIMDNLDDEMRRYLACGITTVMDVGGPMRNFETRTFCDESPLAPNAFVTGPLISTYVPPNLDKKDPPIILAKTEEEAREQVRKQIPFHPDFIKIWYISLSKTAADQTFPMVKSAIDETHKNHLKALVHATELHTARLAVQAGCDVLVHSVDDSLVDESFVNLLKQNHVTLIPTLIVKSGYDRSFSQQFNFTMHDFHFANPFMLGTLYDLQHIPVKDVGRDYQLLRRRIRIPDRTDSNMMENLKRLYEAGVNIASGTDAGNIGTLHASSFLDELLQMKASGLTNAQVLRASTINAARGFSVDSRIGSIEKGKLADLLLLNQNPLDKLENLDSIYFLVHRGKLINTDTLIHLTPESIVQQQVNAYNAHNMEAFLQTYSDSAEIGDFQGMRLAKGKDQLKKVFAPLLTPSSSIHCQIVSRMVQANFIIDKEHVTGMGPSIDGLVIYEISKGKIVKAQFIQ